MRRKIIAAYNYLFDLAVVLALAVAAAITVAGIAEVMYGISTTIAQ